MHAPSEARERVLAAVPALDDLLLRGRPGGAAMEALLREAGPARSFFEGLVQADE